ncbi:MAG: hypothetical protein ACD_28C00389G0001, partial [uncultured bacterium]
MMLFCCNPFKSSRHFNPRLLWYEGKKEVGQGQASEAESTSEAVEASESHEQSEEEKMKFHMQSFLLMAKHIEKKTTDPEFRKSTLGNMVRSAQIFLRRYGGVTQKDNIFFKDITLMRRYLGKNEQEIHAHFPEEWGRLDEELDKVERHFWAYASYDDLLDSGTIGAHDDLIRLNEMVPSELMWPRKLKLLDGNPDKVKVMKKTLENLMNATSPETLDFETFKLTTQDVLEEVQDLLPQLIGPNKKPLLENPFMKAADTELVMSIPILEVISPEYPAPLRVNVFRSLMDAGFQPQAIPSLHDREAIYGLGQTMLSTYKNLWNFHELEMKSLSLPKEFEKCTGIEDQLKVVMLSNALMLEEIYHRNIVPEEFFNRAAPIAQKEFVRVVSVSMHNAGSKAIGDLLKSAMKLNPQNLVELTAFFMDQIKADAAYSNAARHAHQV